MRRFLLILLVSFLALSAASANPFTDGVPTPPVASPVSSGPLAGIQRWVTGVQVESSKRFTQTLAALRDGGSPRLWAGALVLAFLYGAFHAIGPGHGKALVVSYFLSRDATLLRGVWLGVRIAVTHVLSALLIVAVLEVIFRQALPPSVEDMREVKLAAYAAVVLVGLVMLRDAWKGHAAHAHDHDHSHHHAACCADHGAAASTRKGGLISVVAGAVPCTGAILVALFAIGNGMLLTGAAMIAMIALGMAVAMAALGVLAIVARQAIARWAGSTGSSRTALVRALDFSGPALVILFGCALIATTL